MDGEEAEDLWRVRYTFERGSASWGETKYYEDADEAMVEIMNGLLDIQASTTRGWRRSLADRLNLRWVHWHRDQEDDDNDDPRVKMIQWIEKREGDTWKRFTAELIPPGVRLHPGDEEF